MISVLYGGITHHYIGSHLPYCGRLNTVGTIHHEYVIIMAGNSKRKFGILNGRDSACGTIMGPVASFSASDHVDLVIGGYNTNFKDFRKLNIEPPSFFGITPIIGLDFKIPLYKTESVDIELDNIVSLGIITHAIRFNF